MTTTTFDLEAYRDAAYRIRESREENTFVAVISTFGKKIIWSCSSVILEQEREFYKNKGVSYLNMRENFVKIKECLT